MLALVQQYLYDLCMVWTSEKSIKQTLVYSSLCELGDCLFRIPSPGASKPHRVYCIRYWPIEDIAGSDNPIRVCSFRHILYEREIKYGLPICGFMPAWCGIFYLQGKTGGSLTALLQIQFPTSTYININYSIITEDWSHRPNPMFIQGFFL